MERVLRHCHGYPVGVVPRLSSQLRGYSNFSFYRYSKGYRRLFFLL